MQATAENSSKPVSPGYLQAFKDITKLRLILVVAFSGFVGMVMSRRDLPQWHEAVWVMALLILSGLAVSVQNNLLDTEIDAKMGRTAGRNDAIEIFGRRALWLGSSFALAVALAIAFILVSIEAGLLLVVAIISYVIWYTLFLKRKNPFGVILGGIPGAMPLLIGSYAVSGRFAIDVWLLFWLMMLWQPPHFWALSLHIKSEYAEAGVPVLPVVFGNQYTKIFIYLYAFSLLPVSLALYWLAGYGVIYMLAAVVLAAYYLTITYFSISRSEKYKRSFFASLIYITGLKIAILVDILL